MHATRSRDFSRVRSVSQPIDDGQPGKQQASQPVAATTITQSPPSAASAASAASGTPLPLSSLSESAENKLRQKFSELDDAYGVHLRLLESAGYRLSALPRAVGPAPDVPPSDDVWRAQEKARRPLRDLMDGQMFVLGRLLHSRNILERTWELAGMPRASMPPSAHRMIHGRSSSAASIEYDRRWDGMVVEMGAEALLLRLRSEEPTVAVHVQRA